MASHVASDFGCLTNEATRPRGEWAGSHPFFLIINGFALRARADGAWAEEAAAIASCWRCASDSELLEPLDCDVVAVAGGGGGGGGA